MQYVKTSDGIYGYCNSHLHGDRALSPTYNNDISVGDSRFLSTGSEENPRVDMKSWTSSVPSVATVSKETNPDGNLANQGKVIAKKEGVTLITVMMDYTISSLNITEDYVTSGYMSVYTPVSLSVSGKTNKDTASRQGATTDTRAAVRYASGASVTITGQCGSYWRVGTSRYIPKSDIDIPATGITLDRTSAILYKGIADNAVQLNATVTPTITTDKITYESSDTNIANVSVSGKVTAVDKGTATITAKVGTKTAACKITVYVSAAKVTAPLTHAVQVGKSKKISSITITSEDANGYTKTFSSASTKVSTVGSTGSVSAIKEGTTTVKVTLTHKAPSVGTTPKPVSASTFISAYTKVATFTVRTKAANVVRYPGATKSITTGGGTIATKGTLLTVLGKCGDYYYVRYRSNPTKIGFVLKSKVEQVYISHKTAIRGQVFTPKYGDIYLLKKDNISGLSSANVSNKDSGTVSQEKKNGAYTGNITAGKNAGRATLYSIKKDLKGSKTTKAYEQHISVITYMSLSTGYIMADTNVYSCAEMKCYAGKLSKGTKVIVVGKTVGALYISYTLNGNTVYRYVPKSKVSYVTIAPFTLAAGGSSQSKAISYLGDAASEKNIQAATIKSGTDYASVKSAKGVDVAVAPKNGAGYGVLKLEAPKSSGKYVVYDPISVYTDTKNAKGYIKSYTALYATASVTSKYSYKQRMLPANTQLTILGKKGVFFYEYKGRYKPFITKLDYYPTANGTWK
jgi:hypothetical protein